MANDIGKAEEVSLRDIWPKEDKDFTPWLKKNIEVFNEQAGLNVSISEREKPVGNMFVDLVGENENGLVVIENQLGPTDHSHLGQTLTYLAMVGAKTAIWVSGQPKAEHVKTIEWLNETTPADFSFYLVKVRAVRIGDSPPAPLFSLAVSPSDIVKKVGQSKRELAERHYKRKEFWTMLLESARDKTEKFNNITPRYDHWIGIGGGMAGIAFNFTIFKDRGACEIYLDKGKNFEKLNKARFDALFKNKEKIEKSLGKRLVWQRLDNRRACRIRIDFKGIGLNDDKEKWPELQDNMIEIMVKMHDVFQDYIRELE